MDLYPAIDLLDGRCVGVPGDYDRSTVYGDDPSPGAGVPVRGAPWVPRRRPRRGAHRRTPSTATSSPPSPGARRAGADQTGRRTVEAAERCSPPWRRPRGAGHGRSGGPLPGRRRRPPRRRRARRPRTRWRSGAGSRGRASDVLDWRRVRGRRGRRAGGHRDPSRDGTLEGPDLAGLAAVVAATGAGDRLGRHRHPWPTSKALAALTAGGRSLAGAITGRAV